MGIAATRYESDCSCGKTKASRQNYNAISTQIIQLFRRGWCTHEAEGLGRRSNGLVQKANVVRGGRKLRWAEIPDLRGCVAAHGSFSLILVQFNGGRRRGYRMVSGGSADAVTDVHIAH